MSALSRRLFTSSLLAAGFVAPAFAQESAPEAEGPAPLIIYDDGLKAGWNNWSWAKTRLAVDVGADVKPISVEGAAWEALFLQHAPFSTQGYTQLRFGAHGGTKGGQRIIVKAFANDKPIEPGFEIRLTPNEWQMFEIPLSTLGAKDSTIGGLCWQALFDPMDTWYITLIDLA